VAPAKVPTPKALTFMGVGGGGAVLTLTLVPHYLVPLTIRFLSEYIYIYSEHEFDIMFVFLIDHVKHVPQITTSLCEQARNVRAHMLASNNMCTATCITCNGSRRRTSAPAQPPP
jgi:hypothetical protein